MSAFYDQASLVVVPSGYKSGKIYAQKPLTTDGQLTFTRASTATRVNASGLIETVASGVPRLDYLGSTCPKLLLEPQRTNSVLYSEQFDNAAWQKTAAGTGVTPAVTANHAISPDGTQNADLVVFDRGAGNTSSDFSWIYQNFVTSAATYTISCYVKAATSADVGKNLSWRNFGGGAVWDVTLTNEWQRISAQATGSGSSQEVGFYNRGAYSSANSVSVLMWGFQAEVGAYATSYVKTEAAAVTRLADEASKQGISSLLSASEYTLFWEGTHFPTGQFNTFMTIYNNANQNLSALFYRNNTNNEVRAAIFNNAVSLSLYMASGVTASNIKCALRVKAGAYAFYVNGSLVNSSTNALAPASTLDSVTLQYFNATQSFDQKTAQALFFKTGLSNEKLAELTTL
jgi:hypothetical protein